MTEIDEVSKYLQENRNNDALGIDMNTFSLEEELKKYDGLKALGWRINVRLYMAPNVSSGGIIITPTTHDDQKYQNCVGLVIKKPRGSYIDPRYDHTGHWCEVGDWVVFPRHAGHLTGYKNLPIFTFNEDAPLYAVEDPRDVTRF